MYSTVQHDTSAQTNRLIGLQGLIMSRDANVTRSLVQALSESGIAAHPLKDPNLALDAMSRGKFDLVIVDCDDCEAGIELLKSARSTSFNRRSTLLAIVSSHKRTQDAFQAGATMALPRPTSPRPAGLVLRTLLGNMIRERRRSFRIPVEIPVSFGVDRGVTLQATAINVSEDGMCLQSSQQLPANQRIHIRFVLPETKARVEVEGKVAWSDLQGRIGVEFVSVQPAVRRIFHDWLQGTFDRVIERLRLEASAPVGRA